MRWATSCACYNLRRAARAVTQVFDSYLDEVGLKATQFTILAVLSYKSDEAPTVTALAESLVLEQSSLSRNLAVLERKGHVKLVPGADRRERIITLTRSGRAAVVRAYPVWRRAQDAVASGVPAAELDIQFPRSHQANHENRARSSTDRPRALDGCRRGLVLLRLIHGPRLASSGARP